MTAVSEPSPKYYGRRERMASVRLLKVVSQFESKEALLEGLRLTPTALSRSRNTRKLRYLSELTLSTQQVVRLGELRSSANILGSAVPRNASWTDADTMRAQPAQWSDVLDALVLEAATLGEGVAWEDDRARAWWDTGAVTAVAVKDGSQLIAYASAMSISPATFDAIAEGRLDPTDLDLDHTDLARTHHWVGIVVTDPDHQGKGAGRLALEELVGALDGQCIADVYSEGGKALVEKLGWRKVRDGDHPIYITGNLSATS